LDKIEEIIRKFKEDIIFKNKHVTHLFNAMTGIHHREGLAGAALDSDDVTVEIIPVKHRTTDSILAAGLGEGKLEKTVRPFLKTVCWPEVPLRWQTVSEIW